MGMLKPITFIPAKWIPVVNYDDLHAFVSEQRVSWEEPKAVMSAPQMPENAQ